jgi:gas vesicle protein
MKLGESEARHLISPASRKGSLLLRSNGADRESWTFFPIHVRNPSCDRSTAGAHRCSRLALPLRVDAGVSFVVSVPRPVIVLSLMAPFAVMAFGAELQVRTPDPSGSTVIEQALIEHVCSATQSGGARGTDEYDACLKDQLLSLRTDFGRDLSRLSAPERKTLDSACNNLRATRGRDAYVACLSAQLVSLHNRRNRANPAPSEATDPPPQSVSVPPASPAPPALPASQFPPGVWIGATVFIVLAAVGGVLMAMKTRRESRRYCQICSTYITESGDLCQKCRHEAAEAVRNAATERAEEKRAKEAARRRQAEFEEEQLRDRTRQDEEERQRQHQELEARVRQREEDARQRQMEEARQRSLVDIVSSEFDPHAVLGVPPGASKEDILAAYQAAKLKYDPEQVTHLSAEVREHYKAKADAVELAYKKITE